VRDAGLCLAVTVEAVGAFSVSATRQPGAAARKENAAIHDGRMFGALEIRWW